MNNFLSLLVIISFFFPHHVTPTFDPEFKCYATPFNTTAEGKIRVGVIRDQKPSFYYVEEGLIFNGIRAWQNWVNNVKGGVTVGGKNYKVELVIGDATVPTTANASVLAAEVARVTDMLVKEVDFLIGPYSSTRSRSWAPVVDAAGKIGVGTSTAAASVFLGRKTVFGILQDSRYWSRQILKVLIEEWKVSSVYIITKNDALAIATNNAVIAELNTRGVAILGQVVVPEVQTPEGKAAITIALKNSSSLNPDCLLYGGLPSDIPSFMPLVRDINYLPKAIFYTGIPRDYTAEETSLMNGLITSSYFERRMKYGTPGVLGGTTQDFVDYYTSYMGEPPEMYAASGFVAGLVHYSAWTLSNSLDIPTLNATIRNMTLDTFFGPVKFDSTNMNNIQEIVPLQYLNGVGMLYGAKRDFQTFQFPAKWQWTPEPIEIVFVSSGDGAAVAVQVIAALLIAIILSFLVIIIIYRQHPVVAAAGFDFCVLILIGGAIGCGTVYFFSGEPTKALCNLRIWFGGVAFQTAFVPLAAKTYRVWKLFSHKSLDFDSIKSIKREYLYSLVLLFITIEIIFLAIWTGYDPQQPDQVSSAALGKNQRSLECRCKSYSTFVIVFYAMKGSVVGVTTLLSFLTKDVKGQFNESKQIAWMVYNICLIVIVMLPVVYFVSMTPVVRYLIISATILFIITSSIFLLFVYKFFKIFSSKGSSKNSSSTAAMSANSSHHQ